MRGNEMVENSMVSGKGAGAPDRIGSDDDHICAECGENFAPEGPNDKYCKGCEMRAASAEDRYDC